MKRFLICILAVLCALLSPMACAQEATVVRTTVPGEHRITVDCGEGGYVLLDSERHTGCFELTVERLGDLTLKAEAKDGWVLDGIFTGESAGVSIRGNVIRLESVHEDKMLRIRFARAGEEETPAASPQEPNLGDYLGGDRRFAIVFDEEYQPQDFELLPIVRNGELLVCAIDDTEETKEPEETRQHSLILSAGQLKRLCVEHQLARLHFRNGEITASVDLEELYTGELARQIRGLWQPLTAEEEALPEGEDILLTEEELAGTFVELRIAPEYPQEYILGARVQVVLIHGDARLNVTERLTTLLVGFEIDAALQIEPEVMQVTEAESRTLEGAWNTIPMLTPEEDPDVSECFIATYSEDQEYPVILADPMKQLAEYRQALYGVPCATEDLLALRDQASAQ